ncbi:MAG: 1-acyl-sn-glycerol-3-phosphate acyltransferase [Gammaproteobacteria bacterium]|nr:1-acyl-sn-glycerol-3-phosphate acyltransferase [Gammaproteobacteria bacterium]
MKQVETVADTSRTPILGEAPPLWREPQGLTRMVRVVWMWIATGVFLVYFKILNRAQFEGLEHLPRQGPTLIVCNHISELDGPLVLTAIQCRDPSRFNRTLTKMEVFKTPILGSILSSFGCIPINRNGSHIRGMREVLYAMRRGKVVVFPEGTYSNDGKLLSGPRSLGRLIQWVHPVIIPAVIWGTNIAMPPPSRRVPFGGEFGVRLGPALDMAQFYDLPITRETSRMIVDYLMDVLKSMLQDLQDQGRILQIENS